MTLPEELLQDISQFLNKVDELKSSDRKELIITILRKHLIMTESELILTKYDFDSMLSHAKGLFSSSTVPNIVDGRSIDQREAMNLLVIEGAIAVLNSKGAFKRLPKFNRR